MDGTLLVTAASRSRRFRRQTNEQTNRRTDGYRYCIALSLRISSEGLKINTRHWHGQYSSRS